MRWIYGGFGFDSFLLRSSTTTLEFNVVIGMKASAIITLGDVDLCFAAVVVRNFNVKLGIGVAAV